MPARPNPDTLDAEVNAEQASRLMIGGNPLFAHGSLLRVATCHPVFGIESICS